VQLLVGMPVWLAMAAVFSSVPEFRDRSCFRSPEGLAIGQRAEKSHRAFRVPARIQQGIKKQTESGDLQFAVSADVVCSSKQQFGAADGGGTF